MKLEQSFEVAAPLEQVWDALIDVERVAPALPGAAITGRNEDGSYNGTFTIKIGPTTAAYSGKLEMDSVDVDGHTATMRAQGSDKRGQGGAKATIVSRLSEVGERRTRVEVDTDYSITGRLARFGRGGMIEDISERLLREFAERLQGSLVAVDEPAPLEPATQEHEAAPGEPSAPEEPPAQEEPSAQEGSEWVPAEVREAVSPEVGAGAEPPPGPPGEAPGEPGEAPGGPGEAPAAEAPVPEAPPGGSPPPAGAPVPPPPRGQPPLPPPAQPAEPVEGLSLVGGVIVDRIKRNPAPWVAGVVGLLLLRRIVRHR